MLLGYPIVTGKRYGGALACRTVVVIGCSRYTLQFPCANPTDVNGYDMTIRYRYTWVRGVGRGGGPMKPSRRSGFFF